MMLVYHMRPRFLSNNFEMKDMKEATYMIRIKILRDKSQGLLGCLKKHLTIRF